VILRFLSNCQPNLQKKRKVQKTDSPKKQQRRPDKQKKQKEKFKKVKVNKR
jgi:hypothetical protein